MSELVPVLWIVFHTLIGHNIYCVWHSKRNVNGTCDKTRNSCLRERSAGFYIGIFASCSNEHVIYLENYLSKFCVAIAILPSRTPHSRSLSHPISLCHATECQIQTFNRIMPTNLATEKPNDLFPSTHFTEFGRFASHSSLNSLNWKILILISIASYICACEYVEHCIFHKHISGTNKVNIR